MAKQYRRPLLVFYLKEPPKRADRGQDFRVLPEGYNEEDLALVDALLRDIKVRQSLVRNAMLDEKVVEELEYVGSFSQDENLGRFTDKVYRLLKLNIQEYYNKSTKLEAFNFLRSRVEDIGVFVLLIGDLGSYHTSFDTSVFRGFALSDNIAPFVVINDNDSKAAWSFTLLHEFTHLLLGQTGISNSYTNTFIEKLCNSVASHVLLPEGELRKLEVDRSDLVEDLILGISQFADHRNLSNSMVAYRLLLEGIILENQWEKLRTYFVSKWVETKEKTRQASRKSNGGPSYYVIRKHKLGDSLISTVHNMTYDGLLSTVKAGRVLGVSPKRIQNLFDQRLPAGKES
jgi:Zn-dependent peptidase ImmA (M78 family)